MIEGEAETLSRVPGVHEQGKGDFWSWRTFSQPMNYTMMITAIKLWCLEWKAVILRFPTETEILTGRKM